MIENHFHRSYSTISAIDILFIYDGSEFSREKGRLIQLLTR